jgi:hypothetical protein
MLCRALVVILAMSPAALPEASLAYDIKPKTPESAFAAKLRPDILGISTDSTADSARASFESAFKGRLDTKTDKEAAALEAIDRPLDPRTAIKLNDGNGRGSCVAVVKRSQAKEKSLSAMLDEAKGANCDGALSVQLTPGTTPGQVGNAQFTLLDFKRMISAAAIDDNALVAEKNERNPTPQGNAPRL